MLGGKRSSLKKHLDQLKGGKVVLLVATCAVLTHLNVHIIMYAFIP